MKHIMKNHLVKEYAILIAGVVIPCFITLMIDYTFCIFDNSCTKKYIFHIESIFIPISYSIFTGYCFSIAIPIFAHFYKDVYKPFFSLLCLTNIFWLYSFIYGYFSTGDFKLLLFIIIISVPMPISYIFAWRVNNKYWYSKFIIL